MSTDDAPQTTIRVTKDVGELVGADGRAYDLAAGDVVELPSDNADVLLDKDAAVPVETPPGSGADTGSEEPVIFNGPPEPVVDDEGIRLQFPTDEGRQEAPTAIQGVDLGTWVCQQCGVTTYAGVENGEFVDPYCEGCEKNGPFKHDGPGDGLSADDRQAALRAGRMWYPPAGISDEGYTDLWDDVRSFLYDHWDAGNGDDASAIYAGLTAYTLSTWVRPNLEFVPHLMLMGKTTGGKTRLLNTLSRVSYRAMVSASATPASMFRLIDGYNVTYYISEYHGLHPDTRRDLDNVVRSGQKRGEKVTRAEPTADGHEPMTFDPFTHVAIATQYEPDDDIVNRCIQVRSSTANRDMPAILDEDRARALRDRLLYARFRLLESEEWADAEAAAYQYLADRNIDGRTREKLLGLLTVAFIWDRIQEFAPFVDDIVEQDREAAADSEDALVVEAIRDLAFEEIGNTAVLGDADPFGAVEIPYSDIADRYEDMTGTEKSSAWIGHVRKRLGFEKKRTRDCTVIIDPDLGPKLQELCKDLNLGWEALEAHNVVEELPEDEQYSGTCSECGERRSTHRHVTEGYHLCNKCAKAIEDAES